METVTGVFRTSTDARRAVSDLKRLGFFEDRVNLLLPGATEKEVRSVPTSDTEQPGVGEAIGGVVGAAVGIAGGFEVGTIAASAMIPGVGPVIAVGIAAAALAGVGGAVGGAKLGSSTDEKATEGLPADEVFFYEDALRQGRSLVIVLANGKAEAARASEVLIQSGAETLDAAREAWWIGLRPAEEEHYLKLGATDQAQHAYRAGFEAALRRESRGKTLEDLSDRFKWEFPEFWDNEAFKIGFSRGKIYAGNSGAQAAQLTPAAPR